MEKGIGKIFPGSVRLSDNDRILGVGGRQKNIPLRDKK